MTSQPTPPRQVAAICAPYRWAGLCTVPPPGGGLLLLETLGLLDHTGLAAQEPDGVDAAILFIEAEQLALADGGRYLADPDFAAVPGAGLLNEAYLAARAKLIDPTHAIAVEAGEPAMPASPLAQPAPPAARALVGHGTASVAIIDAQGNAIAMTASLEGPFGSHLFVHGFPLNAALADFTQPPADPTAAQAANQIQPGKRPASTLAPAIVLDGDRRLVAVIGSTGGTRLPAYEAQALTALLAWHMDAAHALGLAPCRGRGRRRRAGGKDGRGHARPGADRARLRRDDGGDAVAQRAVRADAAAGAARCRGPAWTG